MKIIAYGSLLNKESLEKTLGRKVAYELVNISGYERVFNAPFGEYAYLNLRKQTSATFRAAYFEIAEEELTQFDEREKGSVLEEIKPGYVAFVWPIEKCKDLPVLQSYIEVCRKGNDALGLDLWQSTKLPEQIIDDLSDVKYL